MATELAFAKSFLSLLDSKPTKLTADHVEDPRNYPASTPYILPRHLSQKPFSKPSRAGSSNKNKNKTPGGGGITVTVRSLRTGGGGGGATAAHPLELSFPAADGLDTSVRAVRERVAREIGGGGGGMLPVDKVKLLFAKRPVGDSKTLRELVASSSSSSGGDGGDEVSQVEFSVMVLGGVVPAAGKKEAEGVGSGSVVAQGLSGRAVLETDEFWGDLRGFLQQRVRDEGVAGEMVEVFKGAWKGR